MDQVHLDLALKLAVSFFPATVAYAWYSSPAFS